MLHNYVRSHDAGALHGATGRFTEFDQRFGGDEIVAALTPARDRLRKHAVSSVGTIMVVGFFFTRLCAAPVIEPTRRQLLASEEADKAVRVARVTARAQQVFSGARDSGAQADP
jgi:hypothetical protein